MKRIGASSALSALTILLLFQPQFCFNQRCYIYAKFFINERNRSSGQIKDVNQIFSFTHSLDCIFYLLADRSHQFCLRFLHVLSSFLLELLASLHHILQFSKIKWVVVDIIAQMLSNLPEPGITLLTQAFIGLAQIVQTLFLKPLILVALFHKLRRHQV